MKTLAKQIFVRDLNASYDVNKDLNSKAIKAAIALGVYSYYLMDIGKLGWATYTKNVMKATDVRCGKMA